MKKIITIDYREQLNNKNKDILDYFTKNDYGDYEIIIEKLPVGDVKYIEISDDNIVVKNIVIERKKLEDVLCSIEDDRTVSQFEDSIEYVSTNEIAKAFTIIIGMDWEKAILKHNYYKEFKRDIDTYFASMIEILAKYSTFGLNVLQVPDVKSFVKLCFKLFSKNVEKVIKHKIIIDHSNKGYENFARSIAALTDGLGIKTAVKIARLYNSYDDIINSDSLEISNALRKEDGKKEGKKPIKTIERFYQDCIRRKKDDKEPGGIQVQVQDEE